MRIAKADFTVACRRIDDADRRPIDGYQAIIRIDTGSTLSAMNGTYTLVQNEQLLCVVEALHENATMDAVCGLAELRDMATPCTAYQFRSCIEVIFLDQLSGTNKARRGDSSIALTRTHELALAATRL